MVVNGSPEGGPDVLMNDVEQDDGEIWKEGKRKSQYGSDRNEDDEDQAMALQDGDDDDDDPVVREIEVYVNRISNPSASADDTDSSGASMYLLQYPLRPIYRPYGDQGRLINIKHRAYQKTLQMHYALNMESDNFDPQRRAEILENQMSGEADNSAVLGGAVPHILNSMPCVSTNSSYGLGLLQGDRLYVTPLTSVLQFRPDFSHVDEEENRARRRAEDHLTPGTASTESSTPTAPTTASKSKKDKKPAKDEKGDGDAVAGDSSSSKATGQQQTTTASVVFPNIPPESEWHRHPPCRVRDFLLGEPWDNVDAFYDPDSTETHEILQLLTSFEVAASKSPKGSNADTDLSMENEEEKEDRPRYKRVSGGPLVPTVQFSSDYQSYVDRLCSIVEPSVDGTPSAGLPTTSGALSYLSLSRLSIDQQVLRILQHRHVESFSKIKSLLTKKISDEELVLQLRSYGEIILGNWVCKSALIYDGLVAHCRDLLLCLLSMEKPINREKVKPYVGNLSMEKLSEMLKELAEYRNNAWHFKLPPDKDFIASFPGPCKDSQERFNKDAVRTLYEKITSISNAQRQTASTASSAQVNKDGAKSAASSSRGDALGLIDAECLNRAMQEALKSGGAQQPSSLLPLVQQHLRQQATDLEPTAQRMALTGSTQLTAEDLNLILPRIAEDVGCGYWALRKTGSAQIDRHRSVILSVFKRQTLNPSDENLRGVTKPQILAEFTARSVKYDLPDFTFRKLMKEFAVNQQGFWVFKGFSEQIKS